MKNEEPMETIDNAIHEHLSYKFKQAGIPMIKFNITASTNNNEFFVTPLFHDDKGIFIKIKVIEMLTEKNSLVMVMYSGTIELTSQVGKEENMFSLLSTDIFKKIAEGCSKIKLNKTGLNCYSGQLLNKDTNDMISVSHITYVDFESLDIQDIDMNDIYSS
jgi:hypothetical protein